MARDQTLPYVGSMKKLLAMVLAGVVAGLSPSASTADSPVVLVELFTSQGCSSCPPADKNLAALAARDDVLALSLHVDYWDYLGWRDTFGRAEHTKRQVSYRDLMGARVIYTPQVIVHGLHDVPGHNGDAIDAAITQARTNDETSRISLVSEAGMLKAVLETNKSPSKCTLWMATYSKSETVQIQRGENAGRSITYHNVVNKLMRVGSWDGTSQRIAMPQPAAGEGIAVWLQDDRTGRVISARFHEN